MRHQQNRELLQYFQKNHCGFHDDVDTATCHIARKRVAFDQGGRTIIAVFMVM